ncbi:Nucleobase-ascorbate transporter 7 [Platanthera guangdongensis]|uniref:Nucleobase-ascorbate transporter 7 n=1 Tax=Platanthera guangdongensis TaxID=2320717 RepID=A0ABR2LD06_9ASPA
MSAGSNRCNNAVAGYIVCGEAVADCIMCDEAAAGCNIQIRQDSGGRRDGGGLRRRYKAKYQCGASQMVLSAVRWLDSSRKCTEWGENLYPVFPNTSCVQGTMCAMCAMCSWGAMCDVRAGRNVRNVCTECNVQRAPESVLLGFQHYLVMLGTIVLIPTILVPQMGGGHEEKARVIQNLLFVAGISTLLQSSLGTRLPIVIGGSFTYLLPTVSIILSDRFVAMADPHERFVHTMKAIQGAVIAASVFQVVIGFCGPWRIIVRFLSPLAAVPIVTLAGLGLFNFGFPVVAQCVEIGLPSLLLLLVLSMYVPHAILKRRVVFDRFSVLITVPIIWAYAHILTKSGVYNHSSLTTQFNCRTDSAGLIGASSWIRVPYPFQWGTPTFNAGDSFAMMAASFASLIEDLWSALCVCLEIPLRFACRLLRLKLQPSGPNTTSSQSALSACCSDRTLCSCFLSVRCDLFSVHCSSVSRGLAVLSPARCGPAYPLLLLMLVYCQPSRFVATAASVPARGGLSVVLA